MSEIAGKTIQRAPVVVVVGHVDHGKTSLLDYIRKTNVADREAGGITQSIGAYEITHNNRKITFIDTPGHEAFGKMRVRSAHVADVAILVVAGDDGVKPQTKESIKVLEQTKTPFVVAITKVDKPTADINKVKNELTANNVLLEGYGGSTSFQPVSAKTGEGINELLDLILLVADVEDLNADPSAAPQGVVLEAKRDARKGNIVTVIVQNGTLKTGDMIATPSTKGKIKMMHNFLGKTITTAGPSDPVMILGFENLPGAGEEFQAGALSAETLEAIVAQGTQRKVSALARKDEHVVRLILKADVAGSLEALNDVMKKIPLKPEQRVEVLSQGVGEISDGEVKDAIATDAIIIGFRVAANATAQNLARVHGVIITTNDIIYKLVEEVELVLKEGEKKPPQSELEILATFSAKNKIQTVGGRVSFGTLNNKARLTVVRNNEAIGRGKILNLQNRKSDVNSVAAGNECGVVFESDIVVQKGDILRAE